MKRGTAPPSVAPGASAQYNSVAFGLGWQSNVVLDRFEQAALPTAPDLKVEVVRGPPAARVRTSRHGMVSLCGDVVRIEQSATEVIDLLPGGCIRITQEPQMPVPKAFFGTTTALILATRGIAPIHGSAVELDGLAVLVCGPAGAGKSSFAATLIGLGGRLISDDLTGLMIDADGHPCVLPGRTGLRLFPELVPLLEGRIGDRPPHPDLGGKLRFTPDRVGGTAPIPLARIIHLDASDVAIPPVFAAPMLQAQLYAWREIQLLGGDADCYEVIKAAVKTVPLQRIVGLADRNTLGLRARVAAAVLSLQDDSRIGSPRL